MVSNPEPVSIFAMLISVNGHSEEKFSASIAKMCGTEIDDTSEAVVAVLSKLYF